MATTCYKLAVVMMAIIIIISIMALSKQVSATLQILGKFISVFLLANSNKASLGYSVAKRSA